MESGRQKLVMSELQNSYRRSVSASDLLFFGRPAVYSANCAHIAHFFEGEAEQMPVLVPFIRAGLARDDQCFLITSPSVSSTIEDCLGVDWKSALGTGRLAVSTGLPEVCELSSTFEEVIRQATTSGRAVIRIACDVASGLGRMATSENLLEWEVHCDAYVATRAKLIVLCQYDLSKCQGDAVLGSLVTHHLIVVDRFVQENPLCPLSLQQCFPRDAVETSG